MEAYAKKNVVKRALKRRMTTTIFDLCCVWGGATGKTKFIYISRMQKRSNNSRTEDRTQNHLGTCSFDCERDIITIRPCDSTKGSGKMPYFNLISRLHKWTVDRQVSAGANCVGTDVERGAHETAPEDNRINRRENE